MSRFSAGRYAKAHCDRCGDKIPYLQLILEWTGLMVCRNCLDPKTALEFPTNHPVDPEALLNPRPDLDVEAGSGEIRIGTKLGTKIEGDNITLELGTVTVTVT